MEAVGKAPSRVHLRARSRPRGGHRAPLPRRTRAGGAAALSAARRAPGPVRRRLRRTVPPGPQSSAAHPQGLRSGAARRRRRSHSLLRASSTRTTVFLEIGAGDGAFTLDVADRARAQVLRARCLARDPERRACTRRVETVLSDGCSVPVPAGTVTLAYSFQVMEHIHPDDALEQLRNLFAVIAPGRLLHVRDAQPPQWPARCLEILRSPWRGVFISRNTPTAELDAAVSQGGLFARWRRIAGFSGRYLSVPLALMQELRVVVWHAAVADRAADLGASPSSRTCSRSSLRAIK